MKVTPYPIEVFLPQPKVARTPGTHVSSIIRAIAMDMGILTPDITEDLSLTAVNEIRDPVAILRMCMGLAWEEWYFPNILSGLGVVHQPGELVIDGIYGTHDGESLDVMITHKREYREVIHECKVTYKSSNNVRDLASQFMWMAQIKAYCKAKGTRFAMLHVLFVCGDYSFPIRPVLSVWQLEFTQLEIDQNWKLLRQYKEERERGTTR